MLLKCITGCFFKKLKALLNKMEINRIIKGIVLLIILGISSNMVCAQTKQDSTKKSKKTDFQRLFKGKRSKVSEGMITLRKMDGKVYFEFPKDMLNKKMLLGSAVVSTSDASYAAASEQPKPPMCIYFTQDDSTIHLRKAQFSSIADSGSINIKDALDKNSIGPILYTFRIKAETPDSSGLVFDATKIFVSGNKNLDPFGPYAGANSIFSNQSPTFINRRSTLADIKAYKHNITVTSYLSFDVTSTFLGFEIERNRPATFLMKRSLVLLPKHTMQPRISDARIGIKTSKYLKFSDHDNGIQSVKYADRWELQPSDTEAYKKGKLVKPANPITFYIDDDFPTKWIEYVKEGIAAWNKAFRKIGFKDAIAIRMFPNDDSDFDPNDITYNTVNYVFSNRQNAVGRTWVDPRSGEILSTSISIYKGVVDKLRNDLFIQTAAADKKVRTTDIPDALLGKAIRRVVSRQVGHSLGLIDNLGASASVPVDSLRSPSYTQKYGITPSVMDPVLFNFVAQPGDAARGVKMMASGLGDYDFYAIKWLYKPLLEARNPQDEVPILKKWISDKMDNPVFRYHRRQDAAIFDPAAVADDLGDDQLKATHYALQNLKFVLKHMSSWVNDEDNDYSFRTKMNFNIINIQFYWYLRHVLNNLGGVYQYAKAEGDPFPAYKVVSKEKQKKSVIFLLKSLENLSWMDNTDDHLNDINGDVSEYIQSALFPYVLNWGIQRLGFSERKEPQNPYTQSEFINDVFDFVWQNTKDGKKPTESELSLQSKMVTYLIRNSPIRQMKGGLSGSSTVAFNEDKFALSQIGQSSDRQQFIASQNKKELFKYLNIRTALSIYSSQYLDDGYTDTADIQDTFYYLLNKSKDIMEKALDKQSGKTKQQYQYLLLKVNKALKVD